MNMNGVTIEHFREVLHNLSDYDIEVVYKALEGFVQTQEGSDEEVLEDWSIDHLKGILER